MIYATYHEDNIMLRITKKARIFGRFCVLEHARGHREKRPGKNFIQEKSHRKSGFLMTFDGFVRGKTFASARKHSANIIERFFLNEKTQETTFVHTRHKKPSLLNV